MPTAIETAKALRDTFVVTTIIDRGDGDDLATYQGNVAAIYQRQVATGETLPKDMRLPYLEFVRTLRKQWQAMIESGVNVEFCDDDPTTLDESGRISSARFFQEYRDTGILRVYRSQGDSILDNEETYGVVWHKNRVESMNSIFRAVHDYMGHFASGAGFGWKGETTAYYSHAETFNVTARKALFSETVGQQAYYAVYKDYAPQVGVWYSLIWQNPPL